MFAAFVLNHRLSSGSYTHMHGREVQADASLCGFTVGMDQKALYDRGNHPVDANQISTMKLPSQGRWFSKKGKETRLSR